MVDCLLEELRETHVQMAFDLYIKTRGLNYTIKNKVKSRGAFSSIYEVEDGNGNTIIMKAVDSEIHDIEIESDKVIKYTECEIEMMNSCHESPYIMDLIDSADIILGGEGNEHVFLLFMPKLIPSKEYFKKTGYKLLDIISMTKDVCKALDCCHSKRILHRDIKADNIYYSPAKHHFVVSDFGVSRTFIDHESIMTRIGSLRAPEIDRLDQNIEGRMNSDIYSLAITFMLIYTEFNKDKAFISTKTQALNSRIREVIEKGYEADPSKRYQTANDFLKDIECAESHVINSMNYSDSAQNCVSAFEKKDYKTAADIAKKGHANGIPAMSCLYAYCLASQNRIDDAKTVLLALVNQSDSVATGLYGIIGRLETINKDKAEDQKMVQMILESAKNGFSVAQYNIGRWLIDGGSGFDVDIEKGLEYIFASINRGYRPAMYYLKKVLKRKSDKVKDVDAINDLISIELSDFSKSNIPIETVKAIATAY